MDPRHIPITDYSYALPDHRIAHYPLGQRDASKLLVYKKGEITETIYQDIDGEIPPGALLVFNNTRVVEARIVFRKETGGQIEIFCLEPGPEYPDTTTAMAQTGKVRWKCLIGGASKWKQGLVLTKREEGKMKEEAKTEEQGESVGQGESVEQGRSAGQGGSTEPDKSIELSVKWIEKLPDCFLVELSWEPAGLSFAEVLHRMGYIPLPPYIKREAEESDKDRYQTVYARHDGSVAAPTAGLHFTEELLKKLALKNITREFVTLHVGAGTFKPVKAEMLGGHIMHAEFIDVGLSAIESLLAAVVEKRPVIPVGTTSLRTIESLYWLGLKVCRNPGLAPGEQGVSQWDAYEPGEALSVEKALQGLLEWMKEKGLERLLTRTQLLITPGYDWKLTSGLVTNFHQPGSTLLLLVAALIGEDWRKIYRYALDNEFRFLSYGDGSLLLR